jgi:lipid-binding SYLF domain-containing protein
MGREVTKGQLDQADRVISEIRTGADKEEDLEHGNCVAGVPDLLKGGFVAGAENGRGVAACRTIAGGS